MTMTISKLFSQLETRLKLGFSSKHSLLMELRPSSAKTLRGQTLRTCCMTMCLLPLAFCTEVCWTRPAAEGIGFWQKESLPMGKALSATTLSDPWIWIQEPTILPTEATSFTTKKSLEGDGVWPQLTTAGPFVPNAPRIFPLTFSP